MHDEHARQSPAQPFQETREGFRLTVGISQIVSRLLAAWLRIPGSWGERFAGFQMLLSWLFALFFAPLLFPRHSPMPMLVFWLASTALLLLHRVIGIARQWNGRVVHRQYGGTPWFPGNEIRVKAYWEPFLVVCVGVLALSFSKPLGSYLILAGIALCLSAGWQVASDNAQIRRIRDARLEQRWLLQRLREEE
jgi:hypothetical protein